MYTVINFNNMRPLILQYTEFSNNRDMDFSTVEYCAKLNLTIDKNTKLPAIDSLNMSTTTGTKTYTEISDSDTDNNSFIMGTITKTNYQIEGTDSDTSF